jgi:CHAT domain-containing protein
VYEADEEAPEEQEGPSAGRAAVRELLLREGRRGPAALPRLKYSREEVEAVAKLLGAKGVLLGERATEAAVRSASASGELARCRYVHFAAHGLLGLGPGQQPALALSPAGDDDGLLKMDEVTRLKLNADLVVLSACRTGQGQLHRGEGVLSLARAFLSAGSRGVVCSLWSVDDRATARLMTALYERLRRGRPSAEALREARRDLIRRGEPPLHWAPFILVGK